MGALIDRISRESGLVLIVGISVLLIAVPVVILRIRSGRQVWPAILQTALEAAILASLLGIFALTLGAFAYGGSGQVNLIPFRDLVDSLAQGEYWIGIVLVDIASNFLLYVPLGLFVALRFPSVSIRAWAPTVVALTAGIEVLQGFVLNRSADVTDVLMNGLGGVVGFVLARAIQRLAARADGDKV